MNELVCIVIAVVTRTTTTCRNWEQMGHHGGGICSIGGVGEKEACSEE